MWVSLAILLGLQSYNIIWWYEWKMYEYCVVSGGKTNETRQQFIWKLNSPIVNTNTLENIYIKSQLIFTPHPRLYGVFASFGIHFVVVTIHFIYCSLFLCHLPYGIKFFPSIPYDNLRSHALCCMFIWNIFILYCFIWWHRLEYVVCRNKVAVIIFQFFVCFVCLFIPSRNAMTKAFLFQIFFISLGWLFSSCSLVHFL